jgi:hypothetical protein
MTAFSVTPLTDVPPPAAQEFPNFIQFQADGTDLGGADADTVNFGAGLTATRGTGENSNVVTLTGEAATSALQVQEDGVNLGAANVDTLNFSTGLTATRGSDNTVTLAAEAAGGASVGVIGLQFNPEATLGVFDGVPFPDDWFASETLPNASWAWDGAVGIDFTEAGVYRIIATCSITANNFEWPLGGSTYGSVIAGVTSAHYRFHVVYEPGDPSTSVKWTDQVVFSLSDPGSISARLYALATDPLIVVSTQSMTLVIERLGDIPE